VIAYYPSSVQRAGTEKRRVPLVRRHIIVHCIPTVVKATENEYSKGTFYDTHCSWRETFPISDDPAAIFYAFGTVKAKSYRSAEAVALARVK